MSARKRDEISRKESTKRRVTKFRDKLKLDQESYKEHLLKDAERKRVYRAKQMEEMKLKGLTRQGKIDIAVKRLKETERKRKYREKKKLEHTLATERTKSDLGAFSCRQSFGKAVIRVKKALPKSPSKKLAVVKKLVFENFPAENTLFSKVDKQKALASVISKQVVEKVQAFYCSDNISRQAPGKRDYKTIRNKTTGDKEKIQKRHMVMAVKEAFALFVDENPEICIKKSKFYQLRPTYVLLSSEMPHNVCVCKLHANFNFVTEALAKVVGVTNFPATGKDMLLKMCCTINSEKCMTGLCEDCSTKTIFNEFSAEFSSLADEITLKKWSEVNGRPTLTCVECTVEEALQSLDNMIQKFKVHCFVKNTQSEYFETKKNNVREGEAIIQVDFAENYTCVAQDEIQSAHWSNTLVTVFTCVAWTTNGKQCYAIISNDLTHDKYSVWVFLNKIIGHLKENHKIEDLSIFSDGCAGQFKSRYNLSNLTLMEKELHVSAEWCFFATSHGKGAVDGVGGTVKRSVWEKVKSRSKLVSSAEEFYSCCLDIFRSDKIKIFFVDSTNINESREILENRWKAVKAIPDIQSKHYFRASTCYPGSIVSGRSVKSEYILTELWDSNNSQPKHSSMDHNNVSLTQEPCQRTRLRYEDIYSDSEDEHLVPEVVTKEEMKAGLFILIELVSQTKKKRRQKYVGIAQGPVEQDNTIGVVFMKEVSMVNSTEQFFKLDIDQRNYTVCFSEVCGVLGVPKMKEMGNRIYYSFKKRIELE